MGWKALERADPDLAAAGAARLSDGYAFLATTRRDGSPRVHPVSPLVGRGRLFIFMDPTSPKGHDLRRDGRYALHAAVGSPEQGQAEFFVTGRASAAEDAASRQLAASLARYPPPDRDVLFELDADRALLTVYKDKGPVRRRWERGAGEKRPG